MFSSSNFIVDVNFFESVSCVALSFSLFSRSLVSVGSLEFMVMKNNVSNRSHIYFGIVDKGKVKVKLQKVREVPIAMIVYKLSCTGD